MYGFYEEGGGDSLESRVLESRVDGYVDERKVFRKVKLSVRTIAIKI